MMTVLTLAALLPITTYSSQRNEVSSGAAYGAILTGRWKELEELRKRAGSFRFPMPDDLPYFEDILSQLASAASTDGKYANVLTGVRIVIEGGADPNARDGAPIISMAAADRHGKIIERLLKYGADPNLFARKRGYSALADALFMRRTRNARLLLKAGADPEFPSKFRREQWRGLVGRKVEPEGRPVRPLGIAAAGGDTEAIRLLLAYRVKVNAKDPILGRTALHEAAEADRPEAIRALIAAGASRRIKDRAGRTPLTLARLAKARRAERALKGGR